MLYGVGRRLDDAPELLFTLRGVDHLALIDQAVTSLPESAKAPPTATLSGDLLLMAKKKPRCLPAWARRTGLGLFCALPKNRIPRAGGSEPGEGFGDGHYAPTLPVAG